MRRRVRGAAPCPPSATGRLTIQKVKKVAFTSRMIAGTAEEASRSSCAQCGCRRQPSIFAVSIVVLSDR
jgi:hypothetical protein